MLGGTPPRATNPHVLGVGDYPPIAVRLDEQGRGAVRYLVGTDGAVTDVTVEKSSGWQRLDEASIVAVRKWRFQPATHNGKPAAIWLRAVLDWLLRCDDVPDGHGFVVMRPIDIPRREGLQNPREGGRTMILGRVSADGSIAQWQLRDGTGYERLDKAAIEIARRWRGGRALVEQNTYNGTLVMLVLWRQPSGPTEWPYCP